VPRAALRDLTGKEVLLAELCSRGPALVFFHKADCPATEIAAGVLPRFVAVPGLALVAASQDEPGEARAFAAESGWEGKVRLLLDPEPWSASEALRVRATPTWFLLAGGRLEAVAEGWSRDDANALAARAAGLLGAAPPVVARADGSEPLLRPG
jgi:hypothetical protein